jgi:hypothetical protein
VEKRIRSPNYPALSLPDAVAKVAQIYGEIHTHSAPREVIAKAMGYAGLNGASATAVSALHKYGLLERVGGDEVKVSERALQIAHPHSPAERARAIRDAANSPILFAELQEKFPGRRPNEELLRNYLVRKGFAPAALSAVISAYRETSEMVDGDGGVYDSVPVQSREEPDMEPAAQQMSTPLRAQATSLVRQKDDENERTISRYDFEGGQHVRIMASEEIETEEALDMVETMIELKRKELARKKRHPISPPVSNDDEGEN